MLIPGYLLFVYISWWKSRIHIWLAIILGSPTIVNIPISLYTRCFNRNVIFKLLIFLPKNQTSQNNDFAMHIKYLWRFVANIAKIKIQQEPMFSWFFKLIFYKLHLFFKMSHNNLFKTYFASEKYWFFGQKINNLKISFLLKHPV